MRMAKDIESLKAPAIGAAIGGISNMVLAALTKKVIGTKYKIGARMVDTGIPLAVMSGIYLYNDKPEYDEYLSHALSSSFVLGFERVVRPMIAEAFPVLAEEEIAFPETEDLEYEIAKIQEEIIPEQKEDMVLAESDSESAAIEI